MSDILIDTNAYTAFTRGDLAAAEVLRHARLLAVNPVVLGELYIGILAGSKARANEQRLQTLLNQGNLVRLAIDDETARVYAAISVALRQAGTPIPTNDIWIAASALQHGFKLFTFDAHFRAVSGLHVGEKFSDF